MFAALIGMIAGFILLGCGLSVAVAFLATLGLGHATRPACRLVADRYFKIT